MPDPAPSGPAADGGRRLRICLVTSEFAGLWRNGGIGTATAGLAEALARDGHAVTVFYARGHLLTPAALRRWTERLAAHGIALAATRPGDERGFAGQAASLGLVAPALVERFLRAGAFDVVHLNDTGGHGHLAAAAARFGLWPSAPKIVVGLHGPTEWIAELNRSDLPPLLRVVAECERALVALSSQAWSPSRYLAGWVAAHGFRAPGPVAVRPYLMPRLLPGAARAREARAPGGPVSTIAFFGRLEERKGLGLFLDVLDAERDWIAGAGLQVAFLGRVGRIGGRPADAEIRRRGAAWPFRWRIESGLGADEAMALLSRPGSLAVMASPADNSPCTVYEAIECGVPFVAAATGGIPEIIDGRDRGRMTCGYDREELGGLLRRAVREGVGPPPRLALPRAEAEAAWRSLHEAAGRRPAARPGPAAGGRLLALAFGERGAPGLEATLRDAEALGPRLAAAFAVVPDDAGGPAGPGDRKAASPGEAAAILARAAADEPGLAVALLRAGIRLDAGALARMADRLRPGEADALAPAARDRAGRIVPPLPYSDRLRGVLDPAETGLALVRAEAAAAVLARSGGRLGPSLAEAVEALAAGGAIEIRPYPEVVTALSGEATGRVEGGAGARRALATRLLRSRLAFLLPYGVVAAERAGRWLERGRRARRAVRRLSGQGKPRRPGAP